MNKQEINIFKAMHDFIVSARTASLSIRVVLDELKAPEMDSLESKVQATSKPVIPTALRDVATPLTMRSWSRRLNDAKVCLDDIIAILEDGIKNEGTQP